MRRTLTTVFAVVLVVGSAFAGIADGKKKIPPVYKNCTALNKKYPHGLGKAGAHDKTKSKSGAKVTTFKKSTKLYKLAIKYNPRLDGDKDGIACEKK